MGLSAKQDCHLWGRACRWRAILARPASCRCLPSGRSSCPVLSHRRVCCVRLRLFAAPTLANVPSPSPGGGGASACAIFLASCGPTGLANFFQRAPVGGLPGGTGWVIPAQGALLGRSFRLVPWRPVSFPRTFPACVVGSPSCSVASSSRYYRCPVSRGRHCHLHRGVWVVRW